MNHGINPGNVQWISTTISETPVSGMQAANVLASHIHNTVVAGYTAKGYNMGGDGN